MSVQAFKDCLRYSIRNPELVKLGGGEFTSASLAPVLAALDELDALERVSVAALDTETANTALRLECERLRSAKERFRLEAVTANDEANAATRELDATRKALRDCERAEVAATRELGQARDERDAAHRREQVAVRNLEAQRERLDRLEAIAAAVGDCRAFDVSAPILQAFIRLEARQ